ncbi:MAG: hypothetical protein AB8B68_00120 [Rickettsiaceae bacterium]
MIKKIILIILLVTIIPIKANAGFWDAVGACFTDPCNCGDSNKRRNEYWDGPNNIYRTVDKDQLCPPWNKAGGRDDHTCLIKKNYPGTGIGYYENLCGEETPESKYMNPKIRVRGNNVTLLLAGLRIILCLGMGSASRWLVDMEFPQVCTECVLELRFLLIIRQIFLKILVTL